MSRLASEYETIRYCQICNADEYKYICPRCGIPYCSVECYRDPKKHIQCSESFYRECVYQKMKNEHDPVKAKKMQDILRRFHEEYRSTLLQDEQDSAEMDTEALDSDDEQPLEKRMKGVDLDNSAQVWKNLTPEEREDFKRFAREYEMKKAEERNFIPAVRPTSIRLVTDLNEPEQAAEPAPSVYLE